MKRISKISVAFLTLLFGLLIIFPVMAQAETKEETLFDNQQVRDVTVSVTYEKPDVKVYLISPSGKTIDCNTSGGTDNITVFATDKGKFILIGQAQIGTWKIRYDKGTNEKINVRVGENEEQMWVRNIVVGTPANGKLPVSFTVEQKGIERGYDYSISLCTKNDFSNGREMLTGSATTNQKVEVEIDMESVNTHDEYYIQVYASYTDNDTEFFDVDYSSKFAYNNADRRDALSDCKITVDESEKYYTLNWEDSYPDGCAGVFIKAYEDGKETVSVAIARSDASSYTAQYLDDTKKIKVELTSMYSDSRMGDALVKEFDIEKGKKDFAVELKNGGLTNSTTIEFSYKNASGNEITTKLNDENEVKLTLNGDGTKQISLKEDENDFSIIYTDNSFIERKLSCHVSIDRLPPEIVVFENIDGAVTENAKIIITGKAKGADKLLINGKEVELNSTSNFMYELELEDGKNEISIKASDLAGNNALYQAQITRQAEGTIIKDENGDLDWKATAKKYLAIIIAGSISLIGIIVLIIKSVQKKKLKKLKAEGKAPSALRRLRNKCIIYSVFSGILMIASIVAYVIRYKFITSKEYIDLAYESVEDAYDYLKYTDLLKYVMIILIIATVFCIVMAILTGLIDNARKNPKKPKTPKKAKEPKQPKAPKAPKAPKQTSQPKTANKPEVKASCFCSECGAKIPANSAFCQNCGKKVN